MGQWLLLRRICASGGIQRQSESVGLGIVVRLGGRWTRMLKLERGWLGGASGVAEGI